MKDSDVAFFKRLKVMYLLLGVLMVGVTVLMVLSAPFQWTMLVPAVFGVYNLSNFFSVRRELSRERAAPHQR